MRVIAETASETIDGSGAETRSMYWLAAYCGRWSIGWCDKREGWREEEDGTMSVRDLYGEMMDRG